jgi:superfamily II DNA or RNA helicase
VQSVIDYVIVPVLDEGQRMPFARITKQGQQIRIRSRRGNYVVRLADDSSQSYPMQGVPEVQVRKGRIEGSVDLNPDAMGEGLLALQGVIRSLFRADSDLHPHRVPLGQTDWKRVPSFPQAETLSWLIGMEKATRTDNFKRGTVLPVANGKTFVAARYPSALYEWHQQRATPGWGKFPKSVLVLDRKDGLDRNVKTFGDELDVEEIAKVYGENRALRRPLDPSLGLHAITRVSYFNRLAEMHRLIEDDPEQPWVVFLDEAHHTGTADGQYQAILQDLDALLRRMRASGRPCNVRVVSMSATLWNDDRDLVVDFLGGNVFGPFLNSDELGRLRRGEKLPELCRTQYYRCVQQGYNAPLEYLDLIEALKDEQLALALNPTLALRRGRKVEVSVALLKEISKKVLRRRGSEVADRGIFYVPTRLLADAYAPILSGLLGAEVRPYHRGEGVDAETYAWFNDERRFGTAAQKGLHKYVLAVELLTEADDIPATNLIVLAKHYRPSRAGFRKLMQMLGRAGRVNDGKPGFRFVDCTGLSRILREGLSSIVVEKRRGSEARGMPIGVGAVDYSVQRFDEEFFRIFPSDGRLYSEYPYFDPEVFVEQGLRVLHLRSAEFGISNFHKEFALKRMALQLAQALPDTVAGERDALLSDLQNEWGWSDGDASHATDLNRIGPRERIYSALFEIALLWNESGGEAIDLGNLHTRDGVQQLISLLLPWKAGLYSEEQIAQFLDPHKGDHSKFIAAAKLFGVTNLTEAGGLRRYAISMVECLDPSPEREVLLEQLKDPTYWGFTTQAASPRRSSTEKPEQREIFEQRQPYQRIARLLHAVRTLAYRSGKLAQDASFEDLLACLLPEHVFLTSVSDSQVEQFLEPGGGWDIILRRLGFFGLTRVHGTDASRLIATSVLAKLKPSPLRDRLEKAVAEQPWRVTDGNSISQGRWVTAQKLMEVLAMAAKILKVQTRQGEHPTELFTGKGMSAFLDLLFLGEVLPWADGATLRRSLGDRGSLRALSAVALQELGSPGFWREHGAQRILVRLVKKARFPRRVADQRILNLLSDARFWSWQGTDGFMALRDEVEASTERIYRALVWLGARINANSAQPPIDLEKLYSAREFSRLIDWIDAQ